MDGKRTPRKNTPTAMKKTLLGSLLSFFGLSQGSGRSPKTGRQLWYAKPTGNRALPQGMQDEVKLLAYSKRMRKREIRRDVHFMQKKLGHHRFD